MARARSLWRVRVLSLVVVAGVLLALPGAAAAQVGPGNPLSPGLPQSQSPPQTTTTAPVPVPQTTTTAGDTGLGGGGVAAIAIGALVVLGGISLFIWRDARRRAPVRARVAGGPSGPAEGRSGSKARQKPRKLSPAERKRRKRGRAR
jgi:hypothetical protein